MLEGKKLSDYLVETLAAFLGDAEIVPIVSIDTVTTIKKHQLFVLGMLIERMQHANYGDMNVLESCKLEILRRLLND